MLTITLSSPDHLTLDKLVGGLLKKVTNVLVKFKVEPVIKASNGNHYVRSVTVTHLDDKMLKFFQTQPFPQSVTVKIFSE